MGLGATPHLSRRSAGRRPLPRLFLEKKEGKKKPKTTFSARNYRFCESAFALGKENERFCKSVPFGRKPDFKLNLYLPPEKNAVFLLSKVFGIFKPFFQKGLKWGLGQRPIII